MPTASPSPPLYFGGGGLTITNPRRHAKLTAGKIDGARGLGNVSSMTGYFPYQQEQESEEQKILHDFQRVMEIKREVEKLKIVAEKKKVALQDLLEAFISEEDLKLYEKRKEIEKIALAILSKQAEEDKIKKEKERNWVNLHNHTQPLISRLSTSAPKKIEEGGTTAGNKNLIYQFMVEQRANAHLC